jgi:hypothetical protein
MRAVLAAAFTVTTGFGNLIDVILLSTLEGVFTTQVRSYTCLIKNVPRYKQKLHPAGTHKKCSPVQTKINPVQIKIYTPRGILGPRPVQINVPRASTKKKCTRYIGPPFKKQIFFSTQAHEFFLFASLMVVDMALLAWMATRYKYVNYTSAEKSS